jgi:hypothetical protein
MKKKQKKDKVIKIRLKVLFTKSRPHKNKKKYDRNKYKKENEQQ